MNRPVLLSLALLFTALIATCRSQSPAPEAERLVGLWGVEQTFGPLVHGDLTIDGRGETWRARIAGFDVDASREKEIAFVLPGGAGEFHGHLTQDSDLIVGHWIQPTSAVHFQRYATPVRLRAVAPRVWRGQVDPLDDSVSFYVLINRDANGSLSAIIRNPEFGWWQRGGVYSVTARDNVLTFSRGKESQEGRYDPERDAISLPLVGNASPLVLTRRSENAVGFFPKTPPQREYTLRVPIAEDDGWAVGSLADAGLESGPVVELVQKILAAAPQDNALNIQSLLIARHGKLAFEEYFHGFFRERPHDTRSAGKTFAPMLVGLARDHGADVTPTTLVYALFPQYKPFANWDERKDKMKVQDLMSMTAGYDCDEDHSQNAPLNEDTMQDQEAQRDWYKFTLDAPMAHDPGGEQAYYCSAELNLTGAAVAQSSGRSLVDLFDEDYAQPLQFHLYHLNLQPTGQAYMGGGAYIRPRDQLKLGQLYLNGGTWNGRRVLSKDWVTRSLAIHAKFEDRFGIDHLYGWGWHIHHLSVAGHTYTEYESGGNGGQLVLILPDLDMVVGFTGGAYGDFQSWGRWGIELVPKYIIRAVSQK